MSRFKLLSVLAYGLLAVVSKNGWTRSVGVLALSNNRADNQDEVDVRFITMVFGSLILAAATQGTFQWPGLFWI